MTEVDFSSLCLQFSNRSDPKRQLEASNQFYSLLWSKKASLQTVIDNLLTHGINNQNEDISSGAIRHLPIILLKHFKDSNLNLTDLILSLLEKNTPDAQNLFQNLEAFLGSASFRNQKAEAERRINVKNATVKNYSSRQVQRESEIENLLISLMETNLETRKRAAKRLFELSNENRLRQEDSKKGVKLMTADSNYEIRLLGAKVILNMAQQSTTQTKSFLEMVILSSAKEKNLEIKSIYNLAVIKMGPQRIEEIIGELSSILTRSNLNSIQNEEISNILILLLSSISTIDLALDICPLLPLILNDYSQKTVQSGIELASLVGSILINSEPLLNTLDHIERPEGSIYLKNTIIERIRKHKIPSLDQNALIVPGERPRQEMARKGSAGRTRSKFFPNGWTNQNQERDLNQAINGQSEGSNQPRSSQSPKARESRSEPTNQNARINKSVPVTPDQTSILTPDPRPLTPDGPKNENEMLSSSLPSSFFHKKKETSIMRKPTIPKSAQRKPNGLVLPSKNSGFAIHIPDESEQPKEQSRRSNQSEPRTSTNENPNPRPSQSDSPRKTLNPLKSSSKYSADFDLLSTFGPDTNPNNYSANQVFQSLNSQSDQPKLIDVEDNNNKAPEPGLESLGSIRRSAKKRKMQKRSNSNSSVFRNSSNQSEYTDREPISSNRSGGVPQATIQAIGKSLSSDLRIGHGHGGYPDGPLHYGDSGIDQSERRRNDQSNHRKPGRPPVIHSYSERFARKNQSTSHGLSQSMSHRPSSLPDYHPDHSLQMTVPSHRQVSPTKSAPPQSDQSETRLDPLQNPRKELDIVLERLNPLSKPHWEETISAIESARKLAMHHSDVIGGRGGEMTSLVIKQCQNGRSRVARSALEAVRDLFRFLRKSLLGQLDAAVKVLLVESGKENLFLREKAEKAMDEVVEVLCADNQGQKVLLSLLQHKNSKNVVVRSMAAKYIHLTVERIGIGRALSDIKDMTDKIIQFTAGAYQDPSPDVRFWGKKLIILLSQHHDFDKLAARHLNQNDVRSILEAAHHLSINGIQKPSSATRSVSGKHKSNSTLDSPKRISRSGPTNVEHALRDDLKSAKARNATNASKLMALSSARDFLESGRPLGGELTNVTDLICSLIRSGVTANSLEALMVAPLVVPHLVSEPILLPSLLNAAAERMNSNGKTQSAALNLIDTICDEGDKSLLLAPLANRIQLVSVGRPRLAEIFCDMCIEISDTKPKIVVKYGQKTLWSILRDHRCRQQSAVLAEVLYSLMGEKIYLEARKENLENEIHQVLNQI